MKTATAVCLYAFATVASGADNLADIRAVLRSFNQAVLKPEAQSFTDLFTSTADYRDPTRSFAGAAAVASLFTNGQVWSERTPPVLQEKAIKMIGTSALVDAEVVQYGSTVVKWSVPVVLVLENEGGAWKISSWRTSNCAIPLAPLH